MKTGIQVLDAMTESPVFVDPDISVEECAKVMAKHHVSSILIQKNDKIKGIISDQDIVRKIIAKGINPIEQKVSEYMATKLITITPEKDIFEALVEMRDANIRHLPVVDGEKVMGLLTLKDVLKIEPQLFELLTEKFELKEEGRKPIHNPKENEGICELCGNYTEKIQDVDGSKVCIDCKDDV